VIELWWALEEDELAGPSYATLNSRDQPGIVSFSVTSSVAPRPVGPNFRKRSRTEALERGLFITEPMTALGQTFPLARPYTTLFNATFTGLVIVDPLNRLEGI